MKKITASFLSLMFLASSIVVTAQTSLPYFTGFDNASEKFGWVEYKLGVDSDPYEWYYDSSSAYSAPESLNHNYPVGGTQRTDDWFVSPEFNFTNGATIDSLRYAFSGFGVPTDGDTIGIYLLNGSADPAAATTVTLLYSFTDSTYVNDNVWRKIDAVDIPSIPGPSYIAFRYTTVANWLYVKLDNLYVFQELIGLSGDSGNEEVIALYPNPATTSLRINTQSKELAEQEWTLNLYNSAGALVLNEIIFANETVDVAHLKGIYLYQIRGSLSQNNYTGRLMIR